MTVMDNRGRIFGRLNLIDLSALVLLLAALPLAYGASLLFQPPRPTIREVGQVDITNAERRIVAGGSLLSAKLKIKGTGFNPMLRAYIDDSPALAFVYETPNSADVLVGPLSPGAHDLILMDGVQPVARSNGAVKIEAPSARVVRAVGWMTDMDREIAEPLKVGGTFPPGVPSHEIAALGPVMPARYRVRFRGTDTDYPMPNRVERQAVMMLRCDPGSDDNCSVGGQQIASATPVMVPLPGPAATIKFIVEEILPAAPAQRARVTVRVDGDSAAMQPRDRDALIDDRAAIVTAAQGGSVTLELGVDPSREGWRYRGTLVKIGGPFTWTTDRYEARGRVTALSVETAK